MTSKNQPLKFVFKLNNNKTTVESSPTPKRPPIPKLKIAVSNSNSRNNSRPNSPKFTLFDKQPYRNQVEFKNFQSAKCKFFNWLLRQHVRKDPHGIFYEQVTDQIAPSYSRIIKNPMCFREIAEKIDKNHYKNLPEIKNDLILVSTNCTKYNQPDTIYYKSGKKMQKFSEKLLSAEQIVKFYKQLPFFDEISDIAVAKILNLTSEQFKIFCFSEKMPVLNPEIDLKSCDKFCDLISSDEEEAVKIVKVEAENDKSKQNDQQILSKIKSEAKKAREKLAKIHPNQKMGYLNRNQDGSINFNILVNSPNEQKQTLGETIGLIKKGSGRPTLPVNVPSFEKSTNRKRKYPLSPIEYLDYGPFGSFAPAVNSEMYETFSDQDVTILKSAYTNPKGCLYAESIQSFVDNKSGWISNYVDRILDSFTKNRHSTLRNEFENKKQIGEKIDNEIKNLTTVSCPENLPQDRLENLKSLSQLGIDVSFLNKKKRVETEKDSSELSTQTSSIQNLKHVQDVRLSKNFNYEKPYDNLIPKENEFGLVNKIELNFTKLIKNYNVKPDVLISKSEIRNSMGIDKF